MLRGILDLALCNNVVVLFTATGCADQEHVHGRQPLPQPNFAIRASKLGASRVIERPGVHVRNTYRDTQALIVLDNGSSLGKGKDLGSKGM